MTGDLASVQDYIDKTPAYMALLSASEGWVIHFTCEDNYDPLWQSDALVDAHVNVMHVAHDLDFSHLSVQACWKDVTNEIQYEKHTFQL